MFRTTARRLCIAILLPAALLPVAAVPRSVIAQAQASERRSVWSGVYTDEQAKRGQKVYGAECARCHADTLAGGQSAPSLAGELFVAAWDGKSLGDLYDRTRTTMPLDSPGRLSDKEFGEVVAYILLVNEFPAGNTELATDVAFLKTVPILQAKPTPNQ